MELTLVKYREDTRKYQCYEVQKSDAHQVSGHLFFPIFPQLPPMFTITIPTYEGSSRAIA